MIHYLQCILTHRYGNFFNCALSKKSYILGILLIWHHNFKVIITWKWAWWHMFYFSILESTQTQLSCRQIKKYMLIIISLYQSALNLKYHLISAILYNWLSGLIIAMATKIKLLHLYIYPNDRWSCSFYEYIQFYR